MSLRWDDVSELRSLTGLLFTPPPHDMWVWKAVPRGPQAACGSRINYIIIYCYSSWCMPFIEIRFSAPKNCMWNVFIFLFIYSEYHWCRDTVKRYWRKFDENRQRKGERDIAFWGSWLRKVQNRCCTGWSNVKNEAFKQTWEISITNSH
jgi:hypothetical protein